MKKALSTVFAIVVAVFLIGLLWLLITAWA